jgi:hypothetical protein
MTMSDALKRIEEKHGVGGNPVSLLSNYCAICDTKAPCNVVKLARALGEMPCSCCDVLHDWGDPDCAQNRAERVLREVAGRRR